MLEAVEKLSLIAQEAGLTVAQFALAWVLRQANVASAIIGASRAGQIEDNAAASGRVVELSLFTRADGLFSFLTRAS